MSPIKEPGEDGWHPFHTGHGIDTNHGYCWVCQNNPSEAENNPTGVDCTSCRFSFHRDCIQPPLEVTLENWRCWCCIMRDTNFSQQEIATARHNWEAMMEHI